MKQATIEIQLPTTLLEYDVKADKVQSLVTEWFVLELFTTDQISSGKAASLLNMTRRDFLDLLHKRRIAYLDYGNDDLADELATLKTLTIDQ